MESDAYIKSIIAKYALAGGRTPSASASAEAVYEILKVWAGQFLLGVSYSGSSAKGTAIAGVADVDLFISLKPETPGTLADIYNSLLNYKDLHPLNPRKQNVSVGVTHGGHSIDLVPGRKQSGNTTDHSLYRSKAGTWTQTNVDKHKGGDRLAVSCMSNFPDSIAPKLNASWMKRIELAPTPERCAATRPSSWWWIDQQNPQTAHDNPFAVSLTAMHKHQKQNATL